MKKDPQVVQWKGKDAENKFMVLYNTAVEEALKEVRPIIRSVSSEIYRDIASPSISVRDEFDRQDYEYFRDGERIPTDDKGKVCACLEAYEESGNGIVKNIVDLMSDFTVQGIEVNYPDKKKERLVREWFHDIVKGPERSKRFANLTCKAANIVVKRKTAKVPLKIIKKFYKSGASPDVEFVSTDIQVEKRELPVSYTFLDPLTVDILSPELSMFIDNRKQRLGLRVSDAFRRKITHPSKEDEELIKEIPADILNQVRSGAKHIKLDRDKVSIYFYNKEDWQTWATPMIYTVLVDLKHLKKMKLADLAALDGAISQIRIWKIGDIEKGLKPSAAAMAKLASVLMNATSGGFLDLTWTQDLQFQEVTSSLHTYLGEAKYIPVLNAIYTGLGIPPLFGGSSNQGSFTNNFIAIKTLIERLESIRNLLKEFWNTEFEIVKKALSLDKEISLSFDRMTLNDESSFLQIMIHLVDRGYISVETVQEMIGVIPNIEEFRIKREWKEQKKGARPPKASPFHKPEWEETWIDSFVKLGELTPSELGLELETRGRGEISPAERKERMAKEKQKPINDLGGRPSGSKDKTKRKSKEVKPRRSVNSFMNLISWATDTQNNISEAITPAFLESLNKKNLRQLTDNEFAQLERIKFSVLSSISPSKKLGVSELQEYFVTNKDNLNIPPIMDSMLKEMILEYSKNNEITVDKTREMQAIVYAAYNTDNNEVA